MVVATVWLKGFAKGSVKGGEQVSGLGAEQAKG
jgi:hypothetical protein